MHIPALFCKVHPHPPDQPTSLDRIPLHYALLGVSLVKYLIGFNTTTASTHPLSNNNPPHSPARSSWLMRTLPRPDANHINFKDLNNLTCINYTAGLGFVHLTASSAGLALANPTRRLRSLAPRRRRRDERRHRSDGTPLRRPDADARHPRAGLRRLRLKPRVLLRGQHRLDARRPVGRPQEHPALVPYETADPAPSPRAGRHNCLSLNVLLGFSKPSWPPPAPPERCYGFGQTQTKETFNLIDVTKKLLRVLLSASDVSFLAREISGTQCVI